MIAYSAPFSEIAADFHTHGIAVTQPGFYDLPRFLELERQNPRYLNNYARFVHERPRDASYDEHVRNTLPIVANIFHDRLRENGRLGACVDISGLISRALEREGIWNYIVKGSLTIEFPKISQISRKYFWSIDSGNFTAAHAWVVAPPFYVVDTSIQLQPFPGNEADHLPETIYAETGTIACGAVEDIISPEVRKELNRLRVPRSKQLEYANPDIPTFLRLFPARELIINETSLKFVPIAITAPETAFESMRAILFSGKTGFEIYSNEIRTALEMFRRPNHSINAACFAGSDPTAFGGWSGHVGR